MAIEIENDLNRDLDELVCDLEFDLNKFFFGGGDFLILNHIFANQNHFLHLIFQFSVSIAQTPSLSWQGVTRRHLAR
jgi:hypothetical protein